MRASTLQPTARLPTPLDARLACAERPHPSLDRLDYNPDLDDDAKQALRAAAGERIELILEF